MKIYSDTLRVIISAAMVIILASCASKSNDETNTFVEEAEEQQIVITGSRIRRTDVEANEGLAAMSDESDLMVRERRIPGSAQSPLQQLTMNVAKNNKRVRST